MIRIRTMTADDVPLGMRLKAQAGWNQTEADWHRYLHLGGDGCFVAEFDGAAVGTTATFLFGPVAWVAMVLVDDAMRGRGIGTALMRHALASLDGSGVRSVRLDATPLGRPIYEKLGFVAEYSLARYEGVLSAAGAGSPAVEPLVPEELADVSRLDRVVTRTERGRLLGLLYGERPEAFRVARQGGAMVGFLTSRPGARATFIGPCIAAGEVGLSLLADARERLAGQRVFIDVPLPNRAAVGAVEAMGLTEQRPLLRMTRGEPVREHIAELWASSGPEKG